MTAAVRYNNHSIDLFAELKERIPIIEAFKYYGVAVNRHNKALCCFHKENSASLVVYPDTNSFYCYACGVGGSVIDFISKLFNLEPLDAAKQLDIDFNLNLSVQELTPEKRAEIATVNVEWEEVKAIADTYEEWGLCKCIQFP